jgi:molecular chaperone GrpE (heat shock protein)
MNHKNNKAFDSFEDSPEMGMQNTENDSPVQDKEPDAHSADASLDMADDYPDDEKGPLLLDMTGNDDDSHPPAGENAGPHSESPRWTNVIAGEDVAIPNDVLRTRLAKVGTVFGAPPVGGGYEAEDISPRPEPDAGPADNAFMQKQGLADEPGKDPSLANLVSGLNLLSEKMDFLVSEFSGKLKYDAHKDKVIDTLHRELQEYKGDIVKKNMQSMVMDLIKIMDDIRKITIYYQDREVEPGDASKLINALEGVGQDIEEVLSIRGIETLICEDDAFAPSTQRALRLVPTADPSRDKTIAYRIAPGFEWAGRVLRKEMVAVYALNPENGKNSEQ